MDEQKMQEDISSIQRMKECGCFKNYIEYIQFPFYKNLVEHSRINFDFPVRMVEERAQHYMHCMEHQKGIHVVIFGLRQKWIQLLKEV